MIGSGGWIGGRFATATAETNEKRTGSKQKGAEETEKAWEYLLT